jgi:ATP-dependent helicase Lhr and Lhr-like helicase
VPVPGTSADAIRSALGARGAVFFPELARAAEGFPGDLLEVLWDMVWAGEVTNDTLKPLRSRVAPAEKGRGARGRRTAPSFRSRRSVTPGSEGRWSLLPAAGAGQTATERAKAKVEQLLRRYGVLTREAISAEGVTGGFSAVYPVLSAMEAVGKLRRGYFVEGLGATQFALPGAEDRLRTFREPRADETATLKLSAVDPAVLVGVAWPWASTEGRPGRYAGAHVILDAGTVIAFVARGGSNVSCFLPEHDPERARVLSRIAEALTRLATTETRFTALVSRIDGEPAEASSLGPALLVAGFRPSARGYLYRGTGVGVR